MKIYPGAHEVVSTEQATVNHIPLAYFKEVTEEVTPIIKIENDFCHESSEEIVYPYQQFDHDSVLFFDENNNSIDESSIYLRRNGTKYYFEPINSIEFIPTSVVYSATVQRDDKFKNNVNYYLNIAASSKELAEKISGLFTSNKNPSNIIVNNHNRLPSSFYNMNYGSADFLFVYESEITKEKLDEYLEQHINVWILGDSFGGLLYEDETISNYELANPQIYNFAEHGLGHCKKVNFNKDLEWEMLPKNEFNYINPFKSKTPELIALKEGKGMVILSDKSIIDNLNTCYHFVFETLMMVYLNGYFETNKRTTFVTDNKIDHYMKMYKKYNDYHPRINLTEILTEDGFNRNINYFVTSWNFDRDDIICLGVNKYKNIILRKTSKTDPEKANNSISIYTTKGTIINYNFSENVIKTIEDKLIISYEKINEKHFININSFKSSINGINNIAQRIEIPDSHKYVLYYEKSSGQFQIALQAIYSKETYGRAFAYITLIYSTDLSCGDIKIYGGGECSKNPNYEMIDTGSMKGRPYRIGSTMIIRLPKRFEKNRDILMAEIKKHMSSGDYPILVFEDNK
jgi:hypothetical protein